MVLAPNWFRFCQPGRQGDETRGSRIRRFRLPRAPPASRIGSKVITGHYAHNEVFMELAAAHPRQAPAGHTHAAPTAGGGRGQTGRQVWLAGRPGPVAPCWDHYNF